MNGTFSLLSLLSPLSPFTDTLNFSIGSFRRVGLEARLASGHYPVGAWFSQVGKLHQVHHLWQYQSMEARRLKREQSWQIDGWYVFLSLLHFCDDEKGNEADAMFEFFF